MPNQHVVKPGECLSSIALDAGFFPESIWDHEANAELREARAGNAHALVAGDVLTIPDLSRREHSVAIDAQHKFRRKGVPAVFRVKLEIDDEPLANEPYLLRVDGLQKRGITDGEGRVCETIWPGAREAVVTLGEGDDAIEFAFALGQLDPADTERGARQRLASLGHACGEAEEFADDLRAFQAAEALAETGELDDATIAKLIELHDGL